MKEEVIVKYPQNLYLKMEIKKRGYTAKYLAGKFGIAYTNFIRIINGHYKGIRVVTELRKELGLTAHK